MNLYWLLLTVIATKVIAVTSKQIIWSERATPSFVESFIAHELVPDIISKPPETILNISFPSGVDVLEGNELTIDEVEGIPTLTWDADSDGLYTLIFCDADPPSRIEPTGRAFLHWLVVNIRGNDVTAGYTPVDILNSHPGVGTGLHRYTFLIYKQPELLDIANMPSNTFDGRLAFSPDLFADKYNLNGPIAGNFYQTQNLED